MTAPVFALNDVTYRYEAAAALANGTPTSPAAQRVALLGADGSGSSTLTHPLGGGFVAGGGWRLGGQRGKLAAAGLEWGRLVPAEMIGGAAVSVKQTLTPTDKRMW